MTVAESKALSWDKAECVNSFVWLHDAVSAYKCEGMWYSRTYDTNGCLLHVLLLHVMRLILGMF
jgi:hypothetical protein